MTGTDSDRGGPLFGVEQDGTSRCSTEWEADQQSYSPGTAKGEMDSWLW